MRGKAKCIHPYITVKKCKENETQAVVRICRVVPFVYKDFCIAAVIAT